MGFLKGFLHIVRLVTVLLSNCVAHALAHAVAFSQS